MKNITILSIATLAALGGCSEVLCTAEVRYSVALSLINEDGAAVEGAVVEITDGVITEACQELDAGLYSCGEELSGELILSMSSDGYYAEELDVTVEAGECGVLTEEITHTMMMVSCTTQIVPAVEVSVLDEDGAAIADAQVSYAPLSEDIGAEHIGCSSEGEVFFCGEDEPGNYDILAEAEGFLPGSAAVTVEMDEFGCHVVTQSVDIVLAAE